MYDFESMLDIVTYKLQSIVYKVNKFVLLSSLILLNIKVFKSVTTIVRVKDSRLSFFFFSLIFIFIYFLFLIFLKLN